MSKRTRLFLRIAIIHVMASMVASAVFDQSLQRHMPVEAEGDRLVWMLPLEVIFVPVRICLAAIGTLFDSSHITFGQRPFIDMTATYVIVTVSLWIVWIGLETLCRSERRQ